MSFRRIMDSPREGLLYCAPEPLGRQYEMTLTPVQSQRPSTRGPALIGSALAGLVFAGIGWWSLPDRLACAFWGIGCTVMLLVLAWQPRSATDRFDPLSYAVACVPVVLVTLLIAGVLSMIVVTSVAWSLMGMVMLLVCLRVPSSWAIGLLLVQSVLFLSWPIWMANLLIRIEAQWLVDLMVSVGPLFAINGAIDPTDAFTHRPLAYRLMNLGQDIPYVMPRSIWMSVIVHLASGLPGVVWYGVKTWRKGRLI